MISLLSLHAKNLYFKSKNQIMKSTNSKIFTSQITHRALSVLNPSSLSIYYHLHSFGERFNCAVNDIDRYRFEAFLHPSRKFFVRLFFDFALTSLLFKLLPKLQERNTFKFVLVSDSKKSPSSTDVLTYLCFL